MFGKIWKLLMPHGSTPPGFTPGGQRPEVRAPPTDRPGRCGSRARSGTWTPGSSVHRRAPGGADDAVRAVDTGSGRTRTPRSGWRTAARHLLRVQRGHVVVLLERVGEQLPVAVVVGDEVVALGQPVERVAVERRDHRPEELAQALARLGVEVDEDEPVPDVAVHRDQTRARLVEVEELVLLLHEGEVAVEVVAPAVVLARELPAEPLRLLARVVVPHELVAAVAADVVERPHLAVVAADDDERRARRCRCPS